MKAAEAAVKEAEGRAVAAVTATEAAEAAVAASEGEHGARIAALEAAVVAGGKESTELREELNGYVRARRAATLVFQSYLVGAWGGGGSMQHS